MAGVHAGPASPGGNPRRSGEHRKVAQIPIKIDEDGTARPVDRPRAGLATLLLGALLVTILASMVGLAGLIVARTPALPVPAPRPVVVTVPPAPAPTVIITAPRKAPTPHG